MCCLERAWKTCRILTSASILQPPRKRTVWSRCLKNPTTCYNNSSFHGRYTFNSISSCIFTHMVSPGEETEPLTELLDSNKVESYYSGLNLSSHLTLNHTRMTMLRLYTCSNQCQASFILTLNKCLCPQEQRIENIIWMASLGTVVIKVRTDSE